MLAVRWYLRFGLSYRDLEELLAERGVEVDHVTLFRWVQRFTPLLVDAARPCRHAVGARWFVDETYVKVAGRWRYVYRAVDQHGQVIDVYVSARRDLAAARQVLHSGDHRPRRTRRGGDRPGPGARRPSSRSCCRTRSTTPTQYANNRVECDHGRLKARLRPMRGLKTDRTAASSSPATRSSRTCAAATTNSASRQTHAYESPQPSTNSPTRSDLGHRSLATLVAGDRATQQCRHHPPLQSPRRRHPPRQDHRRTPPVRYEPDGALHFEGTGETAWGTKWVLVACRSEHERGRMILDVDFVPQPGGEAAAAMACLERTAPLTPGAQAVVYDTALRGVHHQQILRHLGLIPINRVAAAKAGAKTPRRDKAERRTEKSTVIEAKTITRPDGTKRPSPSMPEPGPSASDGSPTTVSTTSTSFGGCTPSGGLTRPAPTAGTTNTPSPTISAAARSPSASTATTKTPSGS